jgi:hypothetical protein
MAGTVDDMITSTMQKAAHTVCVIMMRRGFFLVYASFSLSSLGLSSYLSLCIYRERDKREMILPFCMVLLS